MRDMRSVAAQRRWCCIAAPLVGLPFLLALVSVADSQNVAVSSFNITPLASATISCPDGDAIVGIYSYYDFEARDRNWQLDCSAAIPEPHPLNLEHSEWSSYNELGGPLQVVCPNNSLVSGIGTSYHETLSDRLWRIQCTQVPEQLYVLSVCEWTEESDPVDDISLSIFGTVVAGIHSEFFSPLLDRRWRFLVCALDAVYCEALPILPHGNVSFPSGSGLYPNTVQFECHDGFYLEGTPTAACTEDRQWTEIPTCRECSSIRFCAELVCSAENDSVCWQCDPFSPEGLPLVLDREKNECNAVVIMPTFTFGVVIVTPSISPSSSSIFVPSPPLTALLLLVFLSFHHAL